MLTRLKIAIFEKKITQEKISQATGIPRVYISQAIHGRLNLTAVEKRKIAEYLKMTTEALFDD